MMSTANRRVRAIAHYLPQYHPIPENDEWWGKGFTEWTHVVRAKPLFRGHVQPHLPADLGFYDLRVPETRQAQADLAREHGVEAFCYWHYWFAGKRLLERPFNEVLESGEPDFPFCLGWANHSWSAAWIGLPERVFLEQTYPGREDYEKHFYALFPAFMDHRYIRVEDKPLFLVFKPHLIPEPKAFTDQWRELAAKSGLKGIFFMGIACSPWNRSPWTAEEYGFDGCLTTAGMSPVKTLDNPELAMAQRKTISQLIRGIIHRPVIRRYEAFVRNAFDPSPLPPEFYPAALVNWDNTPRHDHSRGVVLQGCNPESFRVHLRDAVSRVVDRDMEHRLVFLKSWNEWAEGNYLEPDQEFGRGFLEVVREEVTCPAGRIPASAQVPLLPRTRA